MRGSVATKADTEFPRNMVGGGGSPSRPSLSSEFPAVQGICREFRQINTLFTRPSHANLRFKHTNSQNISQGKNRPQQALFPTGQGVIARAKGMLSLARNRMANL